MSKLPPDTIAAHRVSTYAALKACGGNVTRAAVMLSLSRKGLYKRLLRLGIDRRVLQYTADIVDAEKKMEEIHASSDAVKGISQSGVNYSTLSSMQRALKGL